MRGHRGTGALHRSEAQEGATHGRWVSASLVVLLHAGLYLLLRGAGESAPRPPRESDERIRLVWSAREPVRPAPVAASPASPPAIAAVAASGPPPRARAGTAPVPPAAPILHTDQADAWSFDAVPPVDGDGAAGARFRRDVFERGGVDAFAPVNHLPGLRVRDGSFGGWLQGEARRRSCADLRGALSGRPESTAAIMASMRRWECDL